MRKPAPKAGCAFLIGCLVLALAWFWSPRLTSAKSQGTVCIAQQYGLWCALSTIVVQKRLVQKYAPDWNVKEYRFASGPDLRNALAAGRLDVGISGFAPFIKGWSKGVATKTADVMTGYKHELVTRHTGIKDIRAFVRLAHSSPAFKIGGGAGMPHGCFQGLRSRSASAKMPFEWPIRAFWA